MSALTQALVDAGFSARRADAIEAAILGATIDASNVAFTPAGSVAATDVQAAIVEVDGDVTAHVGDTSDAHDASAISVSPTGSVAATDVQAAIAELDSEKQAAATAITQGKKTLWVPASQMTAAGTLTFADITFGGGPVYKVAQFDPTSFEAAHFAIALPKSWDEGTISAQIYWAHPATVTNFGVVWSVFAQSLSNDDAMDNTFNSVSVTDTGGTTSDLYITSETSALTPSKTPAEGDMLALAIGRDATNGSDTLAVDAYLIGVKIFYTTNAGNDT